MLYADHDPGRLVPYHIYHGNRLRPYPGPEREAIMPPIPVLEIDPDLKLDDGTPVTELGDYILYNGHHRRWAALLAGKKAVAIAVLQNDEDLELNRGKEMLRLSPASTAFSDHKALVYKHVLDLTEAVLERERRYQIPNPQPERDRNRRG